MRLFLDTSVLLSASGSLKGASCFIAEEARKRRWKLVSSAYCLEETRRNLGKLGEAAMDRFAKTLQRRIVWVDDAWSSPSIVVFPKAKDKPVLLSALAAESDYLLTLDRADFEGKLGKQFYGMGIRTPGEWLLEQRREGAL